MHPRGRPPSPIRASLAVDLDRLVAECYRVIVASLRILVYPQL